MSRLVPIACLALAIAGRAATSSFDAAIRSGDTKAVLDQLTGEAPVNGSLGLHTPLTLAIVSDKPEIVSLLLKRGAQRTLPYAGPRFSRAAIAKGRKLWDECESCHRLETPGERLGPPLNGLPTRGLSFDDIATLVANGGRTMPAFKKKMSPAEISAVVSYLVASVEPTAGLVPSDLALLGCNRDILSQLTPVPRLEAMPSRIQIGTYAETMGQIVRLQRDLCTTGARFPALAADIEKSRTSTQWLLNRWRQYAPTAWQPGNYDLVWPARAAALERLAPGDPRALQLISTLRADLELAVDDCRNNPKGMGTVRTVNIQTLRNGAPEPGWQVFFKFKIMEAFPEDPGQPFPNLSSPATWKLPPGNYLVYARKRRETTPSMPITVDRRTGDGFQWQLPLP